MTACLPVAQLRAGETAAAFLARYVASRPEPLRRLNELYLDSGEPRSEIAHREGITLGCLMRALDESAPLSEPYPYVVRGQQFAVRIMHALCDDFHGDRFGAFGEPVTLRIYMDERSRLPPEMFRLADWNFMDAGLPFFAGYCYGSRLGSVLCLSGIQSDLAQRYTYLFQARGPSTAVRDGDTVVDRATPDLADRYGRYVPVLRRVFQRQWIPTLLAGVLRACRALGGIDGVALHQFPLESEERRPSSIVSRIHVDLPRRIPGVPMEVAGDGCTYRYHRMFASDLDAYIRRHRGRAD